MTAKGYQLQPACLGREMSRIEVQTIDQPAQRRAVDRVRP